jgi:putative peptidoglycan lipid II flippase
MGWNARTSALALAAAVGVGGCLQLFFLGFSGARYARPVQVSAAPEIRELFRRALPGMIAQSGPQLLLLAGAVVASASPAAVSWIYFASRLVELPLGLVSAATGAVLIPRLSGSSGDDHRAAASTSAAALQLSLGLALPASVGLVLLAHPIVALLLERGAFTPGDTHATALALAILATALPALALTKPLAAIFFARGQMLQPMIATLAGLLITLSAAALAHPHHGYIGVAVAISIGSWLIALWLGAVLKARNDHAVEARTGRNVAFIGLSSVAMGAALAAAQWHIPVTDTAGLLPRAIALGTLIALGMLVYAACLRLLGVIDFRVIRSAFGER